MRNKATLVSWLIGAFTLLWSGPGWGRQLEPWPYDKFFSKAELVIIAKAESVRDAPETALPKLEDYLLPVVTTFEIKHVVKGEYKAKHLELVHFRLKGGKRVINGPLLVKFETSAQVLRGRTWGLRRGQPDYMLFLKRDKDGRFECVSGQIDPELSVKEIMPPFPSGILESMNAEPRD